MTKIILSKKLIATCVLTVCLILLYTLITLSAYYTLYRTQVSLKNNNYNEVLKTVDLDSVLDNNVKRYLETHQTDYTFSDYKIIKPTVKKIIKEKIEEGEIFNNSSSGSISSRGVSISKAYHSIAKETFSYKIESEDEKVELILEKEEGNWIVKDVIVYGNNSSFQADIIQLVEERLSKYKQLKISRKLQSLDVFLHWNSKKILLAQQISLQ